MNYCPQPEGSSQALSLYIRDLGLLSEARATQPPKQFIGVFTAKTSADHVKLLRPFLPLSFLHLKLEPPV
jgi:hypothetical protein